MPTPTEQKTTQARILAYAEAIGWTLVSREAAEQRRGFDPGVPPVAHAKNRSLFFPNLLDTKAREFNRQTRFLEHAVPETGTPILELGEAIGLPAKRAKRKGKS